MQTEILAQSPAGAIEKVDNLKRRQQAIYLRPHTNPDGDTVWIETRPLPADFVSKELYFAKGFRLKSQGLPPPKADESVVNDLELKAKALEEDNARLRELLKDKKVKKEA